MARPQKQGLDYFSLDVDLFENVKVRRIIKSCGLESATIIIHLLCNIYRHKGYYIVFDDELSFDIADRLGTTEQKVNQTIERALQVDFFSLEMNDRYKILTSPEIQQRYLQSTAKRIDVHLIEEYILSDIEKIIPQFVSVAETPVCDNSNPMNESRNEVIDARSTQSKVKDIILNNIKVNNRKVNKDCETSSHSLLKNYFFEFYQRKHKSSYKGWTGRDAKALNQVIVKMKKVHEEEKVDISPPAIEHSIKEMLERITDQWVLDNISYPTINSQFDKIIVNLKNSKNGKSTAKNLSRVSDNYKRQAVNDLLNH